MLDPRALFSLALVLCACAPTQSAPTQSAPKSAPAKTQEREDDGGLFYGPGYSFLLLAPHGWVLDNETGAPHGLSAIYYRQGTSPETLPAMYVRPIARRDALELDAFIASEMERTEAALTAEDAWTTGDGKPVKVRELRYRAPPELRAAAYIEEDALFIELGMIARDSTNYTAGRSALHRLVASYKFISKNVTVEP
jgi:hypothetical protein